MSYVIKGRPDFQYGWSDSMTSEAKRFPKYVYGKRGLLIHKISRVTLRWYEVQSGGNNLIRLDSPIAHAHTICGMFFRLDSRHGAACQVPKPESVLCGRCHGEGATFPRSRKDRSEAMRKARRNLGCVPQSM